MDERRNWNMDVKYGEEKLSSRLMTRFLPCVQLPGAKLMDEEIKAIFSFHCLPISSVARICEMFARDINSF